MTGTLPPAVLGFSEALLILLVTLGVLAFWVFLIWGVLQIVRPRRSQYGPHGGQD